MMMWKLIMIGLGILVLLADFYACVLKKLTDTMGLGWGTFGILLILLGSVPGLSDWSVLMQQNAYIAGFVVLVSVIFYAFLLCMQLSQLTMKNQELAMQVSLLNQENERILRELEKLTGKIKSEL